ncbi:MAG: hypothetical protein HOC70_05970 [Gammaproteobacteria bacterium]|jgi:hypothetical protein|nr:hypothetical protein [Gammaproteobacteria bacterium]MBT4492775.1 hypothetical protein [Gammaproteobacteria bacterium]MBT7370362.1 hypothetical protein [Gammaproteobacteria bacterium]
MKNFLKPKKHNPHNPFIKGNEVSYMMVGYFPKDELRKILPQAMSIPSDEVMTERYPTVKKIEGMHPYMMQLAACHNVQPLSANYQLPAYQELQFFFPVTYTHKKEEQHCTYSPVLYLDYFFGVIGGLTLGLRKEYHRKMIVEETDTSKSYLIKGVIDASFRQTSTDSSEELDPFFAGVFNNPLATVSYFNRTYFYKQEVYPSKVLDASTTYEWRYKGSVIKNNENTFANYSEYSFTVSQAMRYENYFHPSPSEIETTDSNPPLK